MFTFWWGGNPSVSSDWVSDLRNPSKGSMIFFQLLSSKLSFIYIYIFKKKEYTMDFLIRCRIMVD